MSALCTEEAPKTNSLGALLGCKDPAFIRKLSADSIEARRNHPSQCCAQRSAPPYGRCSRIAMLGATRCHAHLPLSEQVRVDVARRERFEKVVLTSTWAFERDRARHHLDAIERRRVSYAWRFDPYMPGQTVAFASESDERRCVEWLLHNGFDVYGHNAELDQPVSAWCRDRSLWAALKLIIKKNISEEHALKKVRRAYHGDKLWHAKRAKAEAAALKAAE
jgi:hypothetical protein